MDLKRAAVRSLGGAALTALLKTTRVEVLGKEHYERWWGARRPCVFALWHGRLLLCSFHNRGEELGTLISQHRDGDYIASIVEGWWGFRAVRGSSSRGAPSALRQIVRTLKGGTAVAITPDGPRGPRQTMKPGALLAAQLAGVPVIPATSSAERAWWVEGWDRFLIPKPYSRVRLAYGEPVFIPRDADEAGLERIARGVEATLNQLTERVDDWRR